jgi:hypothetical protein
LLECDEEIEIIDFTRGYKNNKITLIVGIDIEKIGEEERR